MSVGELLARTRFFKGIERKTFLEHLTWMDARAFHRGQTLWGQEDEQDRVGFVAAGKLKLIVHRPSGRELIADIAGPGSVLDLTVLSRPIQPVTGIGLAQGVLLWMPRPRFQEALKSNPTLALNYIATQSEVQILLLRRLEELTLSSIEARLAALFLRLSEQEGHPEADGIELDLPLSRQDLADLVDTTIETSIRIMSRWSREGIVLTRRVGFLIPSLSALEEKVL